MKLNKRNIETITATGKRQHFFDDDLPGLAIRVSEIGKVSFYYPIFPVYDYAERG